MKKLPLEIKISSAPYLMRLVISLSIILGFSGIGFSQNQGYDLVIKNGLVYNGLGDPPIRSNIGVRDGKMFLIESNTPTLSVKVIDAKGLAVAPGFVDIHSHTPEAILNPDRNSNECFIRQGVTTVVGSPDGYWSLEQFKEVVDSIPKIGVGTNIAAYIGHNGIRTKVMKTDQQRAPTEAELEEMKEDVEEAMKMGALGLSTGLMYFPGMHSETEEIIALAQVAAKYNGIYDSHVRDPVNEWIASNKEVIKIGKEAKIPAKMGHLKAVGLKNTGRTNELIDIVENEISNGLNLVSDQYPYDGAGGFLTLRSILIPTGQPMTNRPLMRNPMADMSPYLKTPEARKEAKKYTENGINNGFSWIKAVGYDGLRIVDSYDYPDLVGKYLSEIANERKIDAFDLLADLVLNSSKPVQVKGGIAEADVQALLVQPWNIIASDGFTVEEDDPKLGHPRSTGTFTKVLGRYVREQGLLSFEEAIRKMTSLPAGFVGLNSRGRISDGLPADLVIFNPQTVIDRSTYSDPNRFSIGIIHVLVNGKLVLEDEKLSTNRPGKFLKRER